MKSSLLLSSLLLLLLCSCSSSASVRWSELQVLLAIKEDLLHDANATTMVDWILPPAGHPKFSPHCNWTGVRCDARGYVEGLHLSRMNLTGHLRNLSGLAYLQVLDISDNRLHGQLPMGLGGLRSLQIMNASANNFSGRLPVDLANATTLEILDLRGGYFEGSIPASYKSLKKLRFLGLSGNNLTGGLPAELGQLDSLEMLIIGYNFFNGPIPEEIGELRNLRYLDAVAAGITGPIPRQFGNLSRLETVYLYGNRIAGEVPKEIGNLTLLTSLDLSDNEITGVIPEEIARLSNLRLLNLMCNRFTGQIPPGLGELPRLEVLELWNNSLIGSLPLALGRSSPLRWLDVSTNLLSGGIPPELCYNGKLEKLILFNNMLGGSIPSSLAGCNSIVRMRLQKNRIRGSIPVGFGWLPRIQRLEIAWNKLTGPVPVDLTKSQSINFIDLSNNQLHLSLPPDILSIPTLQTFAAANNALTGSIPDGLRLCPALAVLDLSSNNLSGGIPTNIAVCERLISLDLSCNSLTGNIPAGVATMPMLSILDLSHNQLSGQIPKDLGTMPALEMLNLSFNSLSGPVPANGMLKSIDPIDLAGNPLLCSGVLPECVGSGSLGHKHKHIPRTLMKWVVAAATAAAVAFLIGVLLVGSKWAFNRRDTAGLLWWRRGLEEGDWPWRMVMFQRVGYGAGDVLAGMKEGNVIGMGATGVVYMVELPNRAIVAVKKIWTGSLASEGIAGEVTLLGRLRHRNIVRVLGLLHNDSDAMVVYEYMENGSLWEALHDGDGKRAKLANWISRYNVAAGIAAGLAYLHHDCRPPVVHRDVKSGNILLDRNMEAKIADFGLARAAVGHKGDSVSVVIGSYGYIAPECAFTSKVDEKSDIYSFGVVLMELLTGKKPVGPYSDEAQDLVEWVRRSLRPGSGGLPEDVLDHSVNASRCQYAREEMVLVLRIALLCTASSPKDRPSMRDVVTMLAEAKPRRKSSSACSNGVVVRSVVVTEKPVFTPAPVESDCE